MSSADSTGIVDGAGEDAFFEMVGIRNQQVIVAASARDEAASRIAVRGPGVSTFCCGAAVGARRTRDSYPYCFVSSFFNESSHHRTGRRSRIGQCRATLDEADLDVLLSDVLPVYLDQ
jgi:hypothetical protein